MKAHLLALTGLLAFWPADVSAGWRYAQWGMSPDQLLKASHKSARPVYPERDRDARKLYQDHVSDMGLRFSATFWFGASDEKLVRITLLPNDPVTTERSRRQLTDQIRRGLTARYGAPMRDRESWVWQAQGDQIALEAGPRIVYRPD